MNTSKKILALLALGMMLFGACTKNPDEAPDAPLKTVHYRTVAVNIASGSREATPESRLEVGNIGGGKVSYKWNDTDSIGVFLLNVQPKQVNNSVVGVVNNNDPSKAAFSFNAEFVDESNGETNMEEYDQPLDMFVYYPYNSSMVLPQIYSSGENYNEPYFGYEYLKHDIGLVYRVPALQATLEDEVGRQGCTKVLSRYGVCYDFLRHADGEGRFEMRHQNAYLRVRVTGSQNSPESPNYGNGEYMLKKVIVRATYFDEEGDERNANIAGTYHMGYDYVENGSVIEGEESLIAISSGGITHVSNELHTPITIKEHNTIKDGSADDAGTYTLLTISPLEFASRNVSRLYFTVELVKKVGEHESHVATITRAYGINGSTIKAGGLYDVTFNAQDPVDEITKLDAEDSANTYIITAPGDYIFTADTPGNGTLPYKTTFAELGISENLIDPTKHYNVDWLWASGAVFEGRSFDDVCEVQYNEVDKTILFGLKDGYYNATGNVVVALYEKVSEQDDSVKEIVWSWHMWLAEPHYSHFRFANTRASIALNNEEWHILDRNLGAEANDLSYKAFGCYYQVGRKDPFIGPNTHGGGGIGNSWWNWTDEGVEDWSKCRLSTLQNRERFGVLAEWKANVTDGSISGYDDVETYRHKYPMWIIARDFEHAHLDRSKYAWVHTEGQADFNTKTLFDPCPPGYKLPTTREWDNFKNNEFEYSDPVAFSSGPFGYCTSTEAVASDKAKAMTNGVYDYPDTHNAWATLAARRDAGDYYEVDEYNGRRYHTVAMSAHGDEIITCIPASGAIQESGAFYSIGANFALWASGRVEPMVGLDYSETRYDAHWFGIKDNWSSDWKESYDWPGATKGDWCVYCPYLRDDANWSARANIANNPIGTTVLGIGTPSLHINESTGHHDALGTGSNYAVPIRCVRQYDSTAKDVVGH